MNVAIIAEIFFNKTRGLIKGSILLFSFKSPDYLRLYSLKNQTFSRVKVIQYVILVSSLVTSPLPKGHKSSPLKRRNLDRKQNATSELFLFVKKI